MRFFDLLTLVVIIATSIVVGIGHFVDFEVLGFVPADYHFVGFALVGLSGVWQLSRQRFR